MGAKCYLTKWGMEAQNFFWDLACPLVDAGRVLGFQQNLLIGSETNDGDEGSNNNDGV